MKTEVALVLDADFSTKLQSIALQMPVWIVHSTVNTVIVKELRSQNISYQLTEFFPEQLESKADLFHKIVYSLDEHHNELSQDPPYNTLLVYGLDLEAIDENVLKELGFCQLQKTEFGFIARKEAVRQQT